MVEKNKESIDIVKIAEEEIFSCIKKGFLKAEENVDKEKSKRGCGCINCARLTTREANSWRKLFFGNKDIAEACSYCIVPSLGGFEIVEGQDGIEELRKKDNNLLY